MAVYAAIWKRIQENHTNQQQQWQKINLFLSHSSDTFLAYIAFIKQLIGDMQMMMDVVWQAIDEPRWMTITTTSEDIQQRQYQKTEAELIGF